MKHAATRDLYCYWDGLRGARLAPERADIDPGAIRRILTDTFIVEVDDAALYPFRLAGTRACGLFGHELRGTSLLDPWRREDRAEMRRLLLAVTDEAAAVLLGVEAVSNQGVSLDLEMLLLPLRHRGQTHARILGSLTTAEFPYWIGVCPVTSLRVTSSRIISARSRGAPLTAASMPEHKDLLRRVGHLAVIQGGRR